MFIIGSFCFCLPVCHSGRFWLREEVCDVWGMMALYLECLAFLLLFFCICSGLIVFWQEEWGHFLSLCCIEVDPLKALFSLLSHMILNFYVHQLTSFCIQQLISIKLLADQSWFSTQVKQSQLCSHFVMSSYKASSSTCTPSFDQQCYVSPSPIRWLTHV